MYLTTPLGLFKVYDQGTITRALQAGEWWDDHLKPILDEARVGVAIDIGAHFGWFTRYLAQRHDQVIAVEPYPESFALLQENAHLLSLNVQCWPLAAYDRVTTLGFDPRNDRTDAGSFGFTPPKPGYLLFPAAPLDLYLPVDAPVTVIKCDAQGADLRALKGLRQTILRCRPLIVFEWEEGMASWHGDVWQNYLDFFAGLSYTVERITPDYWDVVARPQ